MSSATKSRRFGLPFGESAAIHLDGANVNTAAKLAAVTRLLMIGMPLPPGLSPPVAREREIQGKHPSRRRGHLSKFRNP
jgi:hypothetical protein